MSSWIVPEITTRTGSSHARRGVVCQDASGRHSLQDRSGQPVHLMAVADGHGGKRYTHSDVGSRLACELSLNLVAEQLGQWSSVEHGARQRWQEWLEAIFPKTLHQRWLAAVETHWRQEGTETDAGEDSFSPLAYGTTIALVVMTPDWWAHTGLGDWDLVKIGADGDVELVNEEQEEEQTGGEATYSLCLNNAPRHFAARTGVYPITAQQTAFSLLLSTDGVRKSCSTDADFFAIARYLSEAEQPRQGDAAAQFNADLDRISSQGSGDDVSVAIGRWRIIHHQKPLLQGGGLRRLNHRLQRSQAVIVQPRQQQPVPGSSAARPVARSQADPSGDRNREAGSEEPKIPDGWWKRRVPWPVVGLVVPAAALIGATAGTAFLGLGPFTRGSRGLEQPSPELVAALVQQAEMLCKPRSRPGQNPDGSTKSPSQDKAEREDGGDSPNSKFVQADSFNEELSESISASLGTYRKTFKQLAIDEATPDSFLNAPSRYPLGALIAWSFRHPNLEPLEVSLAKKDGFVHRVEFCPELREALRQQWQRMDSLMPFRT